MEVQTTGQMIAAWLPFIIIMVVFVLWGRSANRHYRQHVDDVNAVNQQIVDTNKEMVAELKEIKDVLRTKK